MPSACPIPLRRSSSLRSPPRSLMKYGGASNVFCASSPICNMAAINFLSTNQICVEAETARRRLGVVSIFQSGIGVLLVCSTYCCVTWISRYSLIDVGILWTRNEQFALRALCVVSCFACCLVSLLWCVWGSLFCYGWVPIEVGSMQLSTEDAMKGTLVKTSTYNQPWN